MEIQEFRVFSHLLEALSVYWKNKRESSLSSSNDASTETPEDDQSNSSSSSSKTTSGYYNVMIPLGLYAVVFFIQTVLVTVPDISPPSFLTVTLVGLAVCGTCGAIATAGIVSTAGLYPAHIGINPFFSGQALGGAAVSIANFAAIAIGEDPNDFLEKHCQSSTNDGPEFVTYLTSPSLTTTRRLKNDVGGLCSPYQNIDWAVLFYFLAGCVVLLLCLVGYQLVYQYQSMRDQHVYETVDDDLNGDHQHEANASSLPFSDDIVEESPRIGLELNDRIQQRRLSSEIDENQIEADTFHDEREENIDRSAPKSVVPVVKGPATCIFLTFAITLCVFPSWISELKSSHECEKQFRLDNDLYVPFSFVFFNIGDLLGRLISGYIPITRIKDLSRKLVLCAFLRVLFLPILVLCDTTIGSESRMVIKNDFFSLLVQLLFSVSNGVLVSTSFMWSPQLVGTNATLQERASEIMTFALYIGLLSGSFLAFPFVRFASLVL